MMGVYIWIFLLTSLKGFWIKKLLNHLKIINEKKPTLIEINGRSYECNYISLPVKEYKELLKKGWDSALWDEERYYGQTLKDELLGDSYINGYIFDEKIAEFSITINGEDNVEIVELFIKNKS